MIAALRRFFEARPPAAPPAHEFGLVWFDKAGIWQAELCQGERIVARGSGLSAATAMMDAEARLIAGAAGG